VLQDGALELAQARPGLDAELFHERAPCIPVGVERVLLSAGPVEREDQLLTEALAERVRRDEPAELAEKPVVAPERQLCLVPQLDCSQPPVFELGRLPRHRLPGEVSERRAAPERQRRAQALRGVGRVGALERSSAARDECLEALEVELVRLEGEPVAVAVALDPRLPERLPQAVHVDLERRGGSTGR
jgi:hypothetical protein